MFLENTINHNQIHCCQKIKWCFCRGSIQWRIENSVKIHKSYYLFSINLPKNSIIFFISSISKCSPKSSISTGKAFFLRLSTLAKNALPIHIISNSSRFSFSL